MILAEDPATPRQSVFVQAFGHVGIAGRAQAGGKVAGTHKGIGMIFTQYPAAAPQGVLIEYTCCLVLAEKIQGDSEIARRCERVMMIVAVQGTPLLEGSLMGETCPGRVAGGA